MKKAVKTKYLVEVEGFTEGDSFFVDGPLWYDGEAQLQTYNDKKLELRLNMKFPPSFGILPYTIKKGKIDLMIIIEKEAKGYSMLVTDSNANGAVVENEHGLTVKYGTLNSAGEKDCVVICNKKYSVTFIIHNADKVIVKTSRFPVAVDLIKNR
jgi:hypothetical protein